MLSLVILMGPMLIFIQIGPGSVDEGLGVRQNVAGVSLERGVA